ncbi:MAG: hypothetical protein V7K48_01655 [Nostoc sp.]|uniref:hypothetical protein n=1 Tax=Nostoc sp. TaxID=1180 RepID=UPI002FFCF056
MQNSELVNSEQENGGLGGKSERRFPPIKTFQDDPPLSCRQKQQEEKQVSLSLAPIEPI